MNGYRVGKTNAVVRAGMCTALGVILSMIGLYLPVFSGIIFMVIPLPIAYIGIREGTQWSVIVSAGILILDSVFFGVISASFLCGIFGILGVVMGFCYGHRIRAVYTLSAGAAAVLLALVAEAYGALYILGIPPFLFGGEYLQGVEHAMNASLEEVYAGEMLEQAKENVTAMMEVMEKSLPFAAIGASFFYSWAAMTVGKAIFIRMGLSDIPQLPDFERWEMPRVFIAVYAAVAVAQNFFTLEGMADTAVFNLGILCVMVFWLHGLAVLWWMPRRYPFMRLLRWFIAGVSVMNGYMQMAVVCIGLYDMVSGYRKKRNYE